MILEKICIFKTVEQPLSLLSYNVTCISEIWLYLICLLSIFGIWYIYGFFVTFIGDIK